MGPELEFSEGKAWVLSWTTETTVKSDCKRDRVKTEEGIRNEDDQESEGGRRRAKKMEE